MAKAKPKPQLSIAATRSMFRQALGEKSQRTAETYLAAVDRFIAWCDRQGIASLAEVTPTHLRQWLADMADAGNSDGTRFNRYNGVKALFRWAVTEEILAESPFAKVPPPRPKPRPVPVLSSDELTALLKAARGKSFEAVRDTALIRLLLDTGMRRQEAAGLKGRLSSSGAIEGDLDLDHNVAVVRGKGGEIRACPFGHKTGEALNRYLRRRYEHPYAYREELWLGMRGVLQPNGLLQIIRRRAIEAGLGKAWTHQFRHSWASMMLADGMQQLDVMRLAGWKSPEMLLRYGAAQADQRARAAYQSHSPGDRL